MSQEDDDKKELEQQKEVLDQQNANDPKHNVTEDGKAINPESDPTKPQVTNTPVKPTP